MELAGLKELENIPKGDSNAQRQVQSWVREMEGGQWEDSRALKEYYRQKVSVIKGFHAVFNICGNRYRVWVKIDYRNNMATIKKVGTHAEYDRWDIQ